MQPWSPNRWQSKAEAFSNSYYHFYLIPNPEASKLDADFDHSYYFGENRTTMGFTTSSDSYLIDRCDRSAVIFNKT